MKNGSGEKKCFKRCLFIFCCSTNIFSVVCLSFLIYHCFILLIFSLDAFGGSTPTCRAYFVSADHYINTSDTSYPLSPSNSSNTSRSGYRLNQARTIGLHNSYHVRNSFFSHTSWASYMCVNVREWAYTHPTLSDQLEQGFRVLELDIHARDDALMTYHVQLFDQLTTCYCLSECLAEVNAWSDANPWHFPIVLLLEFKNKWYLDAYIYRGNEVQFKHLLALEQELIASFGGKLITPQLLRGNHSDLLEAIRVDGWPLISEVRGRVMAVLWETSGILDEYQEGGRTDEPVLFTLSETGNDLNGLFDKYGSPLDNLESINASVESGHLVRTRVDSSLNYQPDRRAAGLSSKAQFLMTDFLDPPLFEDLRQHCSLTPDLPEYVCIA